MYLPNLFENYFYAETYMQMFIEALLITAKIWKHPRCPQQVNG
jgi:hypothetical protein